MEKEARRLPQDITQLLATCIRDLLWYKNNVYGFLRECGVPTAVMLDIERKREMPTVKMIPYVLDALYERGDEGFLVARTMLTKIYYWKDIHSVPPDRKDAAVASLKVLQQAHKTMMAQDRYQSEVRSQSEREDRLKTRPLDHKLLQDFRDRFDAIFFLEPHKRGDEYEALLNDIFAYYFPTAFQGFTRAGEQLDGQFYFDGHWYYIEVRWRNEPASAADISVLRDRARSGFAGDVRAVFISYNGYSPECLESLEASQERVILLTGYDFRSVLETEVALDVLLHRIQAYLVQQKATYVSARQILQGD